MLVKAPIGGAPYGGDTMAADRTLTHIIVAGEACPDQFHPPHVPSVMFPFVVARGRPTS